MESVVVGVIKEQDVNSHFRATTPDGRASIMRGLMEVVVARDAGTGK